MLTYSLSLKTFLSKIKRDPGFIIIQLSLQSVTPKSQEMGRLN